MLDRKSIEGHLAVPHAEHGESRCSLPFREVKARAIQFCMRLESQNLLLRSNDWQDLLNDIAADIRSKNKNRERRKKDYAAMSEALAYTSEKKAALEEQISSYNKYINSAMDTMQRSGCVSLAHCLAGHC